MYFHKRDSRPRHRERECKESLVVFLSWRDFAESQEKPRDLLEVPEQFEPWRGRSHTKWRLTREICRWLSSILWLGTDQTCMCGNCPRLGTELPERIRGNNLRSWELELVSISTSLIEKPYNAEASHRGRKKILLQYWVRISSRLNAALPPPKKVQGKTKLFPSNLLACQNKNKTARTL